MFTRKRFSLWQYLLWGTVIMGSIFSKEPNEYICASITAIVAIVSAAVAATAATAAAVSNSVQAKKAKKRADRTIGGLKAENATAYYQDYYRSALNNDSTRAYLKRLDKEMERQNKTLDNSIVSTGATHENALAAKESKNQVMSNAMASAVGAEDTRRQQIRNNYFTRHSALTQQQLANDAAYKKAQQQNLIYGVTGVMGAAQGAAQAFVGDSKASASTPATKNSVPTATTPTTSAAQHSYAPSIQWSVDNYWKERYPSYSSPYLKPTPISS